MASGTRDILRGVHAVLEALRSDERAFDRILVAEGRRERAVAEVLKLAAGKGVPVERIERARLTQMAGTAHHQGVVAVATRRAYVDLETLLEHLRGTRPPALLLADGIEDPANLGAIVRSAEVLGFHGVVIPKRRAVGVTPAVVRASAGAAEHLPIAQVGNLVRAINRLKEEGLWIVGLEASAVVSCSEADLLGPIGIVVGGEGRGMRRLVREVCDALVRVPVRGRVSSLNVAAAAAVAMYEVMRQRSGDDAG